MQRISAGVIWEKIRRFKNEFREQQLKLHWVKAHPERRDSTRRSWTADEYGNWIVDELASKGDITIGTVIGIIRITYGELMGSVMISSPANQWRLQLFGDKNIDVLGAVRNTIQYEAQESEWLTYLRRRDDVTTRTRKWSGLLWRTSCSAWRKADNKQSKQAKLNRLLWCLDLAPTGYRKRQRGYDGQHQCSCGEEAPSRRHILLDCIGNNSIQRLQDLRECARTVFENVNVDGGDERDVVINISNQIDDWIGGAKDHAEGENAESKDVVEDLQCGLWSKTMVEQMTGEVEERNPAPKTRRLLDSIHSAIMQITTVWTKEGWKIWREDFQRRQEADAKGEDRGWEGGRRRQLQRDMRAYLFNEFDNRNDGFWRDEHVG